MTTRHGGYIVVLEQDIREDNAQQIIDALSLVRGVVRVEPVSSSPEAQIWQVRTHARLRKALLDVLDND